MHCLAKEGNSGLIACWNTSDTSLVKGSIKPSDVEGLDGKTFAVYEHITNKHYVLEKKENLSLSLERMKYALFILTPIDNGFAPFGLINKFNSPGTITEQKLTKGEVVINLYEGGTFAAGCKSKPLSIKFNGKFIDLKRVTFENNLLVVKIDGAKTKCQLIIHLNS